MSLIDDLKARRVTEKLALENLSARMTSATASESRTMKVKFDTGMVELKALDARLEELNEQEAREARAAAHRVQTGTVYSGFEGESGSRFYAGAEEVYRPDNQTSFFRDMHAARVGDYNAAERLSRNNAIHAQEVRAGDLSTVAAAGGTFAPPLWLTQEWVPLARAGRVTADLMNKMSLPSGVSSVNLPRITTGTSAAVQVSQNTQVADVPAVTDSVTSGITTVAGQQIVSLQLISQGGAPIDRIILGDLAADHARALDRQVISGTGAAGQLRGLLNGAGVGSTTYTTATPKVTDGTTPANSFYNRLISAINAIATTRYLPPSAIVLHPSRWNWVLEALDSTGRPLILNEGSAFNALGVSSEPMAEGSCGTLAGLPCYCDPNIPTTLGGGTEDRVIVGRFSDCYLWETDLALQTFDSPFANQLSILVRAHSFSSFIPDRFGPAVNVIAGTGLVAAVL